MRIDRTEELISALERLRCRLSDRHDCYLSGERQVVEGDRDVTSEVIGRLGGEVAQVEWLKDQVRALVDRDERSDEPKKSRDERVEMWG